MYQLLTFLALFGNHTRDLQPAYPTFFQPHAEYTSFEFTNVSRYDTANYNWIWQWQDRQYEGKNLPLNAMLPMDCEGAFVLTLRATDKYTNAIFERTECVWVVWSWYDFEPCNVECSIIDAGNVIIWEEFSPYQYRVQCGLDSNCNNVYDTDDLLALLSALNE